MEPRSQGVVASRMVDQGHVHAQYVTTERLDTRLSVWHDTPDGRNPARRALEAIVDRRPRSVLDLGCGTGAFAETLQAGLRGAIVLGVDQSAAMVTRTLNRGVAAFVAEATALPLKDACMDVVYAGWVLYHVADLDEALAEVRRVLRPGGLLLAITNGNEHLADLLAEVGERPVVTSFSSENGSGILCRHFDSVIREDFDTQAVFADHDAARAYLATFKPEQASLLAPFSHPRIFTGAVTLFTAETPRRR